MWKYTEYDELTSIILGSAIEVHKVLGPGLLESTYQKCLIHELKLNQINVESEIRLPIIYKDMELDHGYRIDLLVEGCIVLELKTIESFSKVHYAQILTYMKLGDYPIGFLLNFDVKKMKEGIKRLIL
ncbi:MAG: GxxExxY protein [Bacteroidota bacterium]